MKFKHDSSFKQVMLGDKVLLTPVNAGVPLHASTMELLDNPGCQEVFKDKICFSSKHYYYYVYTTMQFKVTSLLVIPFNF